MLQLAATPACTAPGVPPENVAAVARQESGFHPFAIRDERSGRSHYPDTLDEAEALATHLTGQGHLLGVGMMQLTPPAAFGLTLRQALDPCRNMRAGAQYLADHYRRAIRASLSAYNAGRPDSPRGADYARRVEALAARMPPIAARNGAAPPPTASVPAVPASPPPPTAVSTVRGRGGRDIALARQP